MEFTRVRVGYTDLERMMWLDTTFGEPDGGFGSLTYEIPSSLESVSNETLQVLLKPLLGVDYRCYTEAEDAIKESLCNLCAEDPYDLAARAVFEVLE